MIAAIEKAAVQKFNSIFFYCDVFFIYFGRRSRQPKGLPKPRRNRRRSSTFCAATETSLYDPPKKYVIHLLGRDSEINFFHFLSHSRIFVNQVVKLYSFLISFFIVIPCHLKQQGTERNTYSCHTDLEWPSTRLSDKYLLLLPGQGFPRFPRYISW